MSLIPSITKDLNVGVNGQSVNQFYLYLRDATGAYNATSNLGGYGSPNAAYTDVIKCTILPQLISGSTVGEVDITSGTTPTAINFANPSLSNYWSMTSIETGQSTSVEALTDGVYKLTYNVYVEDYGFGGIDVTFTNGSSTIILTGIPTWTDITVIELLGVAYQIVAGSWNGGLYTFTLSSPFTGTTTTNSGCYTGYWSATYVSAENGVAKCTAQSYVAVARAIGSCTSNCFKETVWNAVVKNTLLDGIDGNIGSSEPSLAQSCVEYLTLICNSNGCGCKC